MLTKISSVALVIGGAVMSVPWMARRLNYEATYITIEETFVGLLGLGLLALGLYLSFKSIVSKQHSSSRIQIGAPVLWDPKDEE